MIEKKKSSTKDLINNIIELKEQIKITNKLSATLRLLTYFTIHLTSVIFYEQYVNLFRNNITLYKLLLFSGLIYTPLTLSSYAFKFLLKNFKPEGKILKVVKNVGYSLSNNILIFFLKNCDFVLTPALILVISLFISDSEIRTKIIGESPSWFIYTIQSLIICGIILALILDFFKATFLRGFSFASRGLFWKVEGNFEQFLLIGYSLNSLFHGLQMGVFGEKSSFHIVGIIFEIVMMFIINFIYLQELPYLDQYIEKFMSYLLIGVSSFEICYEATGHNFDATLKISSFLVPFCIFLTRVYLKKRMKIDYLDMKNIKVGEMTKLMLRGTNTKFDDDDFLYNQGVFRNFLLNKKKLNGKYYQIWKKMMKKSKEVSNFSKSTLRWEYEGETDALMGGQTVEVERRKKEESDKKKQVELTIELHHLVLKDFIKFQNYHPFSCLIFIFWMVENNFILSDIFRSLERMLEKTQSFRNKFYYYSTKKEIEKKLKDYYFKSNALLKDTKKLEEQVSVSNKSEFKLKFLNKIGVDLDFCFFYKKRIKEICDLIEEFTALNTKYIFNLRSQSKNIKELDSIVTKSFKIYKTILQKFSEFHVLTRKVDTIHLSPYFYFLFKCANLHRAASQIFKVYRERMINKKNLIDPNAEELEDINFMSKSILFKVESDKKNFGKILDIFGDIRYLRTEYKELIEGNMNVLIPQYLREAHRKSCMNFFEKKIQDFLGETITTFLNLPGMDYILPVTMKVKMIPYENSNFKYVAGFRYLNSDTNMYMMLDNEENIKNFSYNMRYLFNEAEYYLRKDIKLSDICPEIFDENPETYSPRMKKDPSINVSADKGGEEVNTVFHEKSSNLENAKTGLNSNYKPTKKTKRLKPKGSFVFKFKNLRDGSFIEKSFQTKIVEKNFRYSKYGYRLLILSNEDDHIGDLFDNENLEMRNILNMNEELNYDKSVISSDSDCPVLRSENDETHRVRNFNEYGLSLIKKITQRDSTRQPLVGTSNRESLRQSERSPRKVDRDKFKISVSNFDNGPISEEAAQVEEKSEEYAENPIGIKRYLAIENDVKESLSVNSCFNVDNNSKSEGGFERELKQLSQINSKSVNESVQSQGYNQQNNNLELDDDYPTEEEDDEEEEIERFTEKMIKQRVLEGTGSVFTNSNLQAYKKYYAFEDAVQKPAQIHEYVTLIVLYLISLSITIYFTFSIKNVLETSNQIAETEGELLTKISEHSSQVQKMYSRFLSRIAYQEKLINKNRYSDYNFSMNLAGFEEGTTTDYINAGYDLSNIESYFEHSYNETRDKLIEIMQEIYKFIGEFGEKNSIFFSNKVNYYLRKVEGEKKEITNSFYQGYLLFGTAKILQIEKLPLVSYIKTTERSDLLFIIDNFMNGLMIGEINFINFAFNDIETLYSGVINIVVQNLIVVLCLIGILLLTTIVLVIKIKNSFKETYHSFSNITEGEYDERVKILTDVEDIIAQFKISGYYADFMGYNERGMLKKSLKKKGGKFQNNFYCFKVLAAMSFLVLFYFLQAIFSSSMMLIWKSEVDTALWITNKQKLTRKVIEEQTVFFNSLKQLTILGESYEVNNTKVKEFLPKLKEQMEASSGTIFEIFEESDGYLRGNLSTFLKEKSNASLCESVHKLEERQELCSLLDNKIPSKGYVQSYFRVTQYLKQLHSMIEKGESLNKDILNHKEFIDLEYTWENVYLDSFLELEHELHHFFEEFILKNLKETVKVLVMIMIIFVIVRFLFSLISIIVIFKRIREVAFSYQLLSIDTVIDNTGVRLKFLKLFRLDQKYF